MSEDPAIAAELADRARAACNAVVEARQELDAGNFVLHVRPDAPPRAPLVAGQFVMLGLPRPRPDVQRIPILQRAYSVASAAGLHASYEFQIAIVSGGKLTEPLSRLQPGERMWFGPAFLGKFTLSLAPPELDLVFVATGSGMAPFLSMLRSHPPGTPRPWRRLVLLHGTRVASSLFARAELEARQALDPQFCYLPVLSREPDASGWRGARGRVPPLLESRAWSSVLPEVELDPARTHVFLCGNPQMIQDVTNSLASRGFTPDLPEASGSLHFEKYW